MKDIKGYVNLKAEISLLDLNINKIDYNIASLNKEKENYLELSKNYNELLIKMEQSLKELKGIEKDLAYSILVKGLNVTKAVEKTSFTYDVDPSTIWRSYYPKVKKVIKELKESSEYPV